MKLFFFILCMILSYFVAVNECLKVSFKNKFPIYEEEEFKMTIDTKTEKIPLYTMILLICIKDNSEIEKMVLNPGFLKGLPRKLYGDYFSVLNYTTQPRSIDVIVLFARLSNNADLRIVYIETGSDSLRKEVIEDTKKQFQHTLGTVRITLKLRWKLELIQRTADLRQGGFIVNSVGQLICRASDGSPFSAANLYGVAGLKAVTTNTLIEKTHPNEAVLSFLPTLADHRRRISCRAGPDSINDNINIFHHPTAVVVVPTMTGYVKNGTSLLCRAADGYPTPVSKWIFESGPKDAQLFYNIEGAVLHVRKNAAIGQSWTFKCNSTNSIPNSIDLGKVETVQFVIGEKPVPVLLLVATIISSLVILALLAVIIFRYRSGIRYSKKKKLIAGEFDIHHGVMSFRSGDEVSQPSKSLKDGSGGGLSVQGSLCQSLLSKSSGSFQKQRNPVDLV